MSTETEIKAGDVVCIKSDKNLEMTVERISKTDGSEDVATCVWFVNSELQDHCFYVPALLKLR